MLEDTELALAAYAEVSASATRGGLYLATYGALQALQAQKDALGALTSALGRQFGLDRLVEGRELKVLEEGLIVSDLFEHPR